MTDANPAVSVIIPCYNHAKFLPDAVKSVARQTFRDFEIIIVNDGSTDGTPGVIEELKKEYPDLRISAIHQKNQGLPASRNNGISKSSARYILPLDADDMIEPEYLEETVKVLDEDPSVSIAYPMWKMFGLEEESFVMKEEYNFDLLLEKNILPQCSLYRREAWKEVGGYALLKGYADWEFWIRLGEAGHKGKLVTKVLFLYRKHGHSMLSESLKQHDQLFAEIRKLHPKLYNPEMIDRMLARQAAQIRQLESECLEMKLELAKLRSGRGSLKNAWHRLLRRISG